MDGFLLMDRKVKKLSVVWIFLGVESLLLYFFAPNNYSYLFNLYCFLHYIFSCFFFFFTKKKKNYFDFDVIFFITYLFVMFIYPVFIYQDNPDFSLFKFGFNEQLISKGSALALLGIHAYILGALAVREVPKCKLKNAQHVNYSLLVAMLYMVFILFVMSGGLQTFRDLYSHKQVNSGISYYLLILISSFAFPAISLWYYNIKIKRDVMMNKDILANIPLLFFVFIFISSLLFVGSRTLPIQLSLVVLGLYFMLFHNLSLFKLLPCLLLGAFVMFFISINRSGADVSLDRVEFYDVFLDLIINNRSTYVALDLVEKNGLTLGESMLSSILSPIPFLQSVVIGLLGLNPTDCASSLIITKFSLGDGAKLDFGFGTNVIADLYIAYGTIGVIIGMFSLGYMVNYFEKRSDNIYCFVAYSVMLSYAMYLVRAEYFFFLRLLLWSLAVLNLIKIHPIILKWKKKKF